MQEDESVEIDANERVDTQANLSRDLINRITDRCDAAEIKYEIGDFEDEAIFLQVSMPNGRLTRTVAIWDNEDAEILLSQEFEKYVFLGDFDAIANYENGTIHATVTSIRGVSPGRFNSISRHFVKRLTGNDGEVKNATTLLNLTLTNEPTSPKAQLGATDPFLHLMSSSNSGVALRILNVPIRQHDQALEILTKLSNSLFLQIELESGICLGIVRGRRPKLPALYRFGERRRLPPAYSFPRSEYEAAPTSLYWYAVGARQMPLLQFLAFYQAIEFFFPAYSDYQARRVVENILKAPNFRTDRDSDVGRLLGALRPFLSRGYMSEREQLQATLKECINLSELRGFLTEDKDREQFLGTDKHVGIHRLSINNPNADLVQEIANRVYTIRCRIVHTKTTDESDKYDALLPYTEEEHKLMYDIQLIQYLAQKVIFASGTTLRI